MLQIRTSQRPDTCPQVGTPQTCMRNRIQKITRTTGCQPTMPCPVDTHQDQDILHHRRLVIPPVLDTHRHQLIPQVQLIPKAPITLPLLATLPLQGTWLLDTRLLVEFPEIVMSPIIRTRSYQASIHPLATLTSNPVFTLVGLKPTPGLPGHIRRTSHQRRKLPYVVSPWMIEAMICTVGRWYQASQAVVDSQLRPEERLHCMTLHSPGMGLRSQGMALPEPSLPGRSAGEGRASIIFLIYVSQMVWSAVPESFLG